MSKIQLILDRISKCSYNTTLTEKKFNPKRCMVYQFACLTGDELDGTPSSFYEYRIDDFNFTTIGLKARSTGCKARISLSTKKLKVVSIEDETVEVTVETVEETTGSPKKRKKKKIKNMIGQRKPC